MDAPTIGRLSTQPAADRPDLLAGPVTTALTRRLDDPAFVAEIDPELADTAAFCATYGVSMQESANCVIVAGRRDGELRIAACVVPATARADVNGIVKRRLDVRKASFLPMDDAVAATAMEYGGITPIGLPDGWPILVDPAVAALPYAVVGSGIRRSKLALPGTVLATWPSAEVVEGLGRAVQ